MHKTIKIMSDSSLIIKVDLDVQDGQVVIKKINFGMRQTATKLEKSLMNYINIYCYDVFRNNMLYVITGSKEYKKFAKDNKCLVNSTN